MDTLWAKLTAGGGEPSQCGWLKDKFGLSWQIVDPWRPVETALMTPAHGDHARTGSERYLAAAPGLSLLQKR